MKAKVLILAGAALLLTTVDASAQIFRGRGAGVVTPFGSYGNVSPYYGGYGYNNYGYGNTWNNGYGNTWGYNNNRYGYNRFNQQSYVTPSQSSSYYTPQVVQGAYSTTPGTTTTISPASGTAPAGSKMGLMVTEVKDNSPAKDAGLRRGDVILSIDSHRIQSFDELRSSLKDADKKQVTVEFIDGSNGKTETKKVNVKDTKLGVIVEETFVNQ